MFRKGIDKNNREEMVAFLKGHYRYFTMRSWNRSTSYANDMKIYNLDLPHEIKDKLYDMLDVDDVWFRLNLLKEDFAIAHNHQWQAGWNGRSGGYLVLYSGGRKKLDYKSRCTSCGQLNYKTVEESGCRCGHCGNDMRVNLTSPVYQSYTTGKSIDEDENFEDWSLEELQERVDVVMDFDRLCEDIVAEAVYMAEECGVEEETYYVEKTRKVLAERESA